MDAQKIAELKKRVSGTVAVAGDKAYKTASKLFNHSTFAPGAVVRPESNEDVAATIRFIQAILPDYRISRLLYALGRFELGGFGV